ncbi:recombinase family protein [Streptomyces sp. NPDC006514]|uniref:recombinase family protein n=1 Tax=Streptomyces sp. NPDC006514 TaxID=3154308 RepID=UPI0033AB6D13
MNGDLDEIARAELIEREPCPRCGAPPGSVCRANSGVVAVDYHTGRYGKIPVLKSGPAIRIPAARVPGRTWQPGPEPELDPELLARAGDRIGYARVSSKGQDLAGHVRLLRKADCVRIYVEKVGTREKIRPEYNAALADLRPADTLTVTMLDRLGCNMVELITSAQDLAERDHRLEILGGPLSPQGDMAADLGVGAEVIEGGVEPVAGPGQGGREGVGGLAAVHGCERGEGVVVGVCRSAVDDLAVAGALEEFVGARHQVSGVDVEAAGEVE